MIGERVQIPLFPLGTVLFPGLMLPLRIFEERYRELVRDLIALPDDVPRRFGVIAIRQGREVGADSIESLYEIGTIATVTRINGLPDGRFEVLTVGAERFTLVDVDRSRHYLQGEVELLDPPDILTREPAPADDLAPQVAAAYRSYLGVLGETRGQHIDVPTLPDNAETLSWLVAATVVVDLTVRQHLLEQVALPARLAAQVKLLRSETSLLKTMAAAPAPDLVRLPQHPN